jgi:hypothetical protein
MTDTQRIYIEKGIWHSGYEPHDMPGAWARTRYTLTPADGGGMLPNGWHNGMMTGNALLCVKSGGEYCNGYLINQNLRDFFVEFDEEYHDTYKAGLERGYKGKRKCSHSYLLTKPADWRDGYYEGLRTKKERSCGA